MRVALSRYYLDEVCLELGDVELYFSHTRVIGIRIKGKLYVISTYHSRTTSRHMSNILGIGDATSLDADSFLLMLDNIRPMGVVDPDPIQQFALAVLQGDPVAKDAVCDILKS